MERQCSFCSGKISSFVWPSVAALATVAVRGQRCVRVPCAGVRQPTADNTHKGPEDSFADVAKASDGFHV